MSDKRRRQPHHDFLDHPINRIKVVADGAAGASYQLFSEPDKLCTRVGTAPGPSMWLLTPQCFDHESRTRRNFQEYFARAARWATKYKLSHLLPEITQAETLALQSLESNKRPRRGD
jgi:hypothetical protein